MPLFFVDSCDGDVGMSGDGSRRTSIPPQSLLKEPSKDTRVPVTLATMQRFLILMGVKNGKLQSIISRLLAELSNEVGGEDDDLREEELDASFGPLCDTRITSFRGMSKRRQSTHSDDQPGTLAASPLFDTDENNDAPHSPVRGNAQSGHGEGHCSEIREGSHSSSATPPPHQSQKDAVVTIRRFTCALSEILQTRLKAPFLPSTRKAPVHEPSLLSRPHSGRSTSPTQVTRPSALVTAQQFPPTVRFSNHSQMSESPHSNADDRREKEGVGYDELSGLGQHIEDMGSAFLWDCTPLVIFLAGTSGSGKSTLGGLLAQRLGIHTILPTDAVREQLRHSLCRQKHSVGATVLPPSTEEPPLSGESNSRPARNPLFFSTYEAYRGLPQKTVAGGNSSETNFTPSDVLEGYLAQCTPIQHVLRSTIHRLVTEGKSVIVEGVHLTPAFMSSMALELMHLNVLAPGSRPPAPKAIVCPFLIQIDQADKHRERFAVRVKSMSLLPDRNNYIKNFDSIRTIQEYLLTQANESTCPLDSTDGDGTHPLVFPVCKVRNTNSDRSLLRVHGSIVHIVGTVLRGFRLFCKCRSEEEGQLSGEISEGTVENKLSRTLLSWICRSILDGVRGSTTTKGDTGARATTSGALDDASEHDAANNVGSITSAQLMSASETQVFSNRAASGGQTGSWEDGTSVNGEESSPTTAATFSRRKWILPVRRARGRSHGEDGSRFGGRGFDDRTCNPPLKIADTVSTSAPPPPLEYQALLSSKQAMSLILARNRSKAQKRGGRVLGGSAGGPLPYGGLRREESRYAHTVGPQTSLLPQQEGCSGSAVASLLDRLRSIHDLSSFD